MKRVMVAFALLCMIVPAPHAAHAGEACIALGTHTIQPLNQNPWSCRFTATGPSSYVAMTANPYHIWMIKNGQVKTFVYRGAPGPPQRGDLDTKGGDEVFVSITCWDWVAGDGCQPGDLGGRHGMIVAHSEI